MANGMAGFGPTLGVGGSMRRAEGMGTTKLFGSAMHPKAPMGVKQSSGMNMGPTPGSPAFSAGSHQVMPHIRHWS